MREQMTRLHGQFDHLSITAPEPIRIELQWQFPLGRARKAATYRPPAASGTWPARPRRRCEPWPANGSASARNAPGSATVNSNSPPGRTPPCSRCPASGRTPRPRSSSPQATTLHGCGPAPHSPPSPGSARSRHPVARSPGTAGPPRRPDGERHAPPKRPGPRVSPPPAHHGFHRPPNRRGPVERGQVLDAELATRYHA